MQEQLILYFHLDLNPNLPPGGSSGALDPREITERYLYIFSKSTCISPFSAGVNCSTSDDTVASSDSVLDFIFLLGTIGITHWAALPSTGFGGTEWSKESGSADAIVKT